MRTLEVIATDLQLAQSEMAADIAAFSVDCAALPADAAPEHVRVICDRLTVARNIVSAKLAKLHAEFNARLVAMRSDR